MFLFCVFQVRHGSVTDQAAGAGPRQQIHMVELFGPVLPGALAGLSRLFANTTRGAFSASFAVHDPTTPFNSVVRRANTDDEAASDDGRERDSAAASSSSLPRLAAAVGSSSKLDDDMCHVAELGKQGLKDLVYSGGFYTWTSN